VFFVEFHPFEKNLQKDFVDKNFLKLMLFLLQLLLKLNQLKKKEKNKRIEISFFVT
jgi:hypothetical protein